MGLFKEIAIPLVARGVPVIPLRPKTKIAFLMNWEKLATTNPAQIDQWDQEYLDANGASVAFARPDGVWFLEIDKPGFEKQIETETGQKLPETFVVRSSPGRGHFYFKQTTASIAMGNVQGKDSEGKETWSARVDNRYVVAPGSYHPVTERQYEILHNAEIVEAPDWLVQWCVGNTQVKSKTGHAELDNEEPIAEGGRNNALTSILGKARQVLKMDREQLFAFGLSINEKRCRPPLSEAEVRTIANSISGYPVQQTGQLNFDTPLPQLAPVAFKTTPYPIFPRWVIEGTSIGEGLVKPICKMNNSYPEFIFMPAMVLMLNYLGLKVQIEDKKIVPTLYLISIGEKGRAFKSTGVQDAIDYFEQMNYLKNGTSALRNAEGRSVVWTPGSTEGLGLEMGRINCKNAVIYYDEFQTLVDKASIEKSSMMSHLSLMYESKNFSNTIKSRKDAFTHEAGQYCTSLLACTTDKAFGEQWAKLPRTGELGIDDRFFFLYQPETWLPIKPRKYVNTVSGAMKTKELIEKAVLKNMYPLDEFELENSVDKVGGARNIGLIEKIALYFAVDMGKEEIDDACIERAVHIVKYGIAVKNYIKPYESRTLEGELQQKIIDFLRKKGGSCIERDLHRAIHPERYGTYTWSRTYGGLVQAGWVSETGKGTKGEPNQIVLMRLPEED